jgi:hypothetical protein
MSAYINSQQPAAYLRLSRCIFLKRNACEPPYNGLMAQLNINTLVSPKTQILNFNLH